MFISYIHIVSIRHHIMKIEESIIATKIHSTIKFAKKGIKMHDSAITNENTVCFISFEKESRTKSSIITNRKKQRKAISAKCIQGRQKGKDYIFCDEWRNMANILYYETKKLTVQNDPLARYIK